MMISFFKTKSSELFINRLLNKRLISMFYRLMKIMHFHFLRTNMEVVILKMLHTDLVHSKKLNSKIKIAQLMQTVLPEHVTQAIINVLLKVNTLLCLTNLLI